MLRRIRTIAWLALFISLLSVNFGGIHAYAQYSAGDSCTPDQYSSPIWEPGVTPGGAGQLLVCDGSNWIRLFEYYNDGNVSIGQTGAVTVPVGTDAQRPGTPAAGMIRYNSDDTALEYYNGSIWTSLDGSGGTVAAAGSDRQIQFNDGGSFGADTNFVYTSAGDFIVGSYQLDDTGTGTEDYRMFFDVSKGAFRAGRAQSSQWNDVSVGDYSVAMGSETIASGTSSTALGRYTTASGGSSTALGYGTEASGGSSTAIGHNVTVSGDYSAGFGLGYMTTDAVISGGPSFGIFMGAQDGVTFAANNTIGMFGGSLLLDPAVPATQLTARATIDFGAATDAIVLPAGTEAERPSTPAAGMIRFSSTLSDFEGYDGSAWSDFGGIDSVTGEPAPSSNYYLNDLNDVNAGSPTSGECLAWSGTEWANTSCGGSISTVTGEPSPTFSLNLTDISDVSAASPSSGECITWSGTEWVNGVCGSGVTSVSGQPEPTSNFAIEDLSDVVLTSPATDQVLTFNGSNWVNATASGSATPAGSDRQIQFNDSNALGADTNFVYTSAGDFIVGSHQLDDTGTGNEDYRMFFDVSKGAFRAGFTDDDDWDDVNVGSWSTALGNGTTASSEGAFASGIGSRATGYAATAMGYAARAYGTYATALGETVTASGSRSVVLGKDTSASGDYSMAIGLGDATSTNPVVSGQSSLGIFMGDQDGIDVATANTMAVLGGDFIVGSYQLDDTGTGNQDNRMFFDVSKGAFRAGVAQATEWNDVNVGNYSFVAGFDSRASGSSSIALGENTVASGYASFATGANTDATNSYSTAMGNLTTASGLYSTAIGNEADATGANSMAIGLGDQTSDVVVSGASSLGIFMGDQSGVDVASSNTMAIMGGNVGIENIAPNVELDVDGDIEYTGTIADMSDRRLKTDIENLPEGQLEKIAALQGVSFKMKDDPEEETEYGFIAQEVQPHFPTLVLSRDDGMLSLNYVGFIAPMVEAIKELKTENEELRARIEKLEAKE